MEEINNWVNSVKFYFFFSGLCWLCKFWKLLMEAQITVLYTSFLLCIISSMLLIFAECFLFDAVTSTTENDSNNTKNLRWIIV